MLSLLKIQNIALIDSLEIEFGEGLNLLTGETGSGKSIIVDSLGVLTGARASSDLIKEGEQSARIEGLFSLEDPARINELFERSGVEMADDEVIVRRELSTTGKNRIFVNDQLATQGFLRSIGPLLVDIHGQGEQVSLFDPGSHLEMLDRFAGVQTLRAEIAAAYQKWAGTRAELTSLRKDEVDKLQLVDILKFQVGEIRAANLKSGENEELEEEKRRLNNVEKLSALSEDSYALLYEDEASTSTTLERAARKVEELAQYDSRFAPYIEQLRSAEAVISDLAISLRDFSTHIEFSPERLEEIENRLAEIARLCRKYGGTIDTVLGHLEESEQRLNNIESAEFREKELRKQLAADRTVYVAAARCLHDARVVAAAKFENDVETNLGAVALEKAKFQVQIDSLLDLEETATGSSRNASNDETVSQDRGITPKGSDRVEFLFSANPGESPKPLARVASGGEASRLMLILKTTVRNNDARKTAVFDEIDVGIGGRVAEAVGLRLKELSRSQQVLCVTHQPQIASLADRHFVVSKDINGSRTRVGINELADGERVDEIARMLAGASVTDAARENAREMLRAGRERDPKPAAKARRMRK
jgi:DNA repair protein RecN (Recombination protein N)